MCMKQIVYSACTQLSTQTESIFYFRNDLNVVTLCIDLQTLQEILKLVRQIVFSQFF